MNKRVIYPNQDGTIAIVIPVEQSQEMLNIICKKDVPAGIPYKIIDADLLPEDRTFRDAWSADFSEPDGFGIGAKAYFTEIYTTQLADLKKIKTKLAKDITNCDNPEDLKTLKDQLYSITETITLLEKTVENL